ncbi:MAG: LPS export ABC transporter ATP-binding protein, partial [candidate division Zixibacteria bacterium]|nr:LPS export ABC transporter ATP-binding protein [candidate division Zixibacteria bacterium]
MEAVLSSLDLKKTYRNRAVVDKVSISVNPGEIVGLLGPNGAGKTTTFYMIIGFIRPDNGSIHLGDKNISKLPMYKRANLGIGYLAQEASVFRKMTVEENIMSILEFQDYSRKERKNKLDELLNELDITNLRKNKAYTLSGGERRRVEITRALVNKPKFILLDEPFAGIDPIAVEDIQRIIERLVKKNLGVLITDHNVRETLSICNRAYIMCDGQILTSGSSEFLANDPEARKVY